MKSTPARIIGETPTANVKIYIMSYTSSKEMYKVELSVVFRVHTQGPISAPSMRKLIIFPLTSIRYVYQLVPGLKSLVTGRL